MSTFTCLLLLKIKCALVLHTLRNLHAENRLEFACLGVRMPILSKFCAIILVWNLEHEHFYLMLNKKIEHVLALRITRSIECRLKFSHPSAIVPTLSKFSVIVLVQNHKNKHLCLPSMLKIKHSLLLHITKKLRTE